MDDHQTTTATTTTAAAAETPVDQQFLPGSMKVPIPIVQGPTTEDLRLKAERDRAEALAGQICASAVVTAQTSCHLLELIGTFDGNNGVRYWTDIKSLAHWLSWTCSMTPPFKTLADIEYATAGWADWYNHRRLHSSLDYNTPTEHEQAYYAALTPQEQPTPEAARNP